MATKNLIQLLASGLRDLGGAVLAGGKVYHYETGTTTLKALYTDGDAGTAAAQPIILDSRGCAKVYGTGLYDLVVQDADGAFVETITGLNAGDAPGSLTAASILTLLKTVDGASSGLDADLLDGSHASRFLTTDTYTAADILTKLKTVDGVGSGLDADLLDGNSSAAFATAAQGTKADAALPAATYTAADILAKLLTVDGPGSNLDADKLDGVDSTGFAAASHALSAHSDLAISTPTAGQVLTFNGTAWANAAPSTSAGKGLAGVVYSGQTLNVTADAILVRFYREGSSPVIAVYSLTKTGVLSYDLLLDGQAIPSENLVALTRLTFQYGAGFSGAGNFILVFF